MVGKDRFQEEMATLAANTVNQERVMSELQASKIAKAAHRPRHADDPGDCVFVYPCLNDGPSYSIW